MYYGHLWTSIKTWSGQNKTWKCPFWQCHSNYKLKGQQRNLKANRICNSIIISLSNKVIVSNRENWVDNFTVAEQNSRMHHLALCKSSNPNGTRDSNPLSFHVCQKSSLANIPFIIMQYRDSDSSMLFTTSHCWQQHIPSAPSTHYTKDEMA